MKINMQCSCGTLVAVSEAHVGQMVKCPACNTVFRVLKRSERSSTHSGVQRPSGAVTSQSYTDSPDPFENNWPATKDMSHGSAIPSYLQQTAKQPIRTDNTKHVIYVASGLAIVVLVLAGLSLLSRSSKKLKSSTTVASNAGRCRYVQCCNR